MLYTLNLCSIVCQLYINKIGGKTNGINLNKIVPIRKELMWFLQVGISS